MIASCRSPRRVVVGVPSSSSISAAPPLWKNYRGSTTRVVEALQERNLPPLPARVPIYWALRFRFLFAYPRRIRWVIATCTSVVLHLGSCASRPLCTAAGVGVRRSSTRAAPRAGRAAEEVEQRAPAAGWE